MLELAILKKMNNELERSGYLGRVGLLEWARDIGIPKNTFYRAVRNCINMGFIKRVGQDKYCLVMMYQHELNGFEQYG